MAKHTLIVGLGSPHGDDRLGWLLVDQLAVDVPEATCLHRAAHPLDILDWLDECERLIVCDASEPAGQPGRIRRYKWPDDSIRQLRSTGTHDLSLPSALGLAARTGRLSGKVVVWTVEAKQCGPCDAVSPEVETAVPQVVAAIRREVEPSLRGRPLNRTAAATDE